MADAADLGAPKSWQGGDAPSPIWSGVYLGVHAGYAAGDDEAQEINGARNYIAEFDGAIGGAHVGWQRQTGNWVAGVEAEAGYLGLGSSIERDVAGGTISSGADLGGYAAISGRLGVVLSQS